MTPPAEGQTAVVAAAAPRAAPPRRHGEQPEPGLVTEPLQLPTVERLRLPAAAMHPHPVSPEAPSSIAALLLELEERSRSRPDRVLRLRGTLPTDRAVEPFELLIFRGFSSLTTHPTAFDPDQPALPEGSRITSAELLQGPLNPDADTVVAGPGPVEGFLESGAWM